MYASQINRRKALICVDFFVFSGERCCMPVRSTDAKHLFVLIFWCSVEKDVVCQSDQQTQRIDLC